MWTSFFHVCVFLCVSCIGANVLLKLIFLKFCNSKLFLEYFRRWFCTTNVNSSGVVSQTEQCMLPPKKRFVSFWTSPVHFWRERVEFFFCFDSIGLVNVCPEQLLLLYNCALSRAYSITRFVKLLWRHLNVNCALQGHQQSRPCVTLVFLAVCNASSEIMLKFWNKIKLLSWEHQYPCLRQTSKSFKSVVLTEPFCRRWPLSLHPKLLRTPSFFSSFFD